MPNFRSKKLLGVMIVAIISIAWFGVAKALFNPQINYQGKLTNNSDAAVMDGTYNMQFKLCSDSGCATELWSEVRTSTNKVQVTNGLFSVMLGEVATTSLSGVDFDQDVYLELQVGGTSTPSFEILLPRKRFGSVPNAFNAAKLGGKLESEFGTLAENEIITGAWNFNNILSITANSSSPALSILQSGAGTGISVGNGTATTTINGGSTSTFPYGATFATTGGRVGVGTLSPGYTLDVAGTLNASSTFTAPLVTTGYFSFGNSVFDGGGINMASPKSFFNLGTDTHASAIFSSNVYIVNDTLKTAITHSSISGSVLKIPGNGKPNQGSFVFYTAPLGSVTADAAYAGVVRMIIGTDGNIGMGTTAPGKALEINSATGANLRLTYNDSNGSAANYTDFSIGSDGAFTVSTTNNATTTIVNGLVVNTNSLVVNKASGNVGIGTLNPQSVLDVYSTKVGGDTLTFKNANTADYMYLGVTNNSDKQLALIAYGDTQAGTILGNNRAGAAVILGFNNPTSLLIGTIGDQPVVLGRNNTEAMRVGASNKIGIGTTVPDKALEINSATGANLRLTYNDNNGAAANFTDFSIGSDGALTVSTTNSATTTFSSSLAVVGSLGIGTITPSEKLQVSGGNILHTATGSPTLKSTLSTTDATGPVGIYVSGKYAYVADYNAGLKVFDISNPAAPTQAGALTGLSTRSIYVSGRYAYIGVSDGLKIVDISNSASPTLTGTLSGRGIAQGIYVAGKYAYMANNTNGLDVVDISNPTAPTLKGNFPASSAKGVYVSGKYAYLTINDTFSFKVVDISNPASPTLVGTAAVNPSSDYYGVYVSGKYAYVAADSGLRILDISNPTSPVVTGTLAISSGVGIYVSGKYAYVTARTGGLKVVDISTPASPILVGTLVTTNAQAVYISGKYAYIADGTGGTKIIDINGLETPSLYAGNIATNDLTVYENIDIGNNLYVKNGLNIGMGGLLSNGAIAITVSTTISTTTLFSVGTSTANMLTVIGNGNVGIGTSLPGKALEINSATGANLRLTYNDSDGSAANYTDFSVGSDGALTVSTTNNATTTIVNGLVVNTNSLVVNKASGNVGIGTTNPLALLSVGAGSFVDASVPIQASTGGVGTASYWGFNKDGTYGLLLGYSNGLNGWTASVFRNVTTDPMYFVTNNTNLSMSILSSGYVGIGTNNPVTILSNSATNSNDYRGYGVQLGTGMVWKASGAGYGISFEQTGTGAARNGALFKTASVDTDATVFVAESGSTGRIVARADGYVGFNITTDYSGISANYTFNQLTKTSGSPTMMLLTAAPHTTLTASTEAIDLNFNLARTVQFSTGDITSQRAAVIRAPTYGAVGASTITNAATFALSGAPVAGTNMTITNPLAFWVQSGKSRFDGDLSVTGSISIGTTTLSERLRVYDGTLLVDGPAHPTLLGSYDTLGTTHAVDISGKYAYVADGTSGLEIFEISNPASPALIGYYDTAGEARDVKIVGKYAYVADNSDGLLIFDISDPVTPILVGSYNTPAGAYGVNISGKYAYVADINSLIVLDISNPKNPIYAAELATVSPIKVYVAGEYAYLAKNTGGSGGGLSIVNISDPLNPVLASTTASTFNSYDVYASGRYAYLANGDNNNVLVYDVSVPTAPALSFTLSTVGSVRGVFAAGSYIYVTDTSTFYIYNAAGGALVGSYAINDGNSLKIIGKHAYVANGTSGFSILDIKGADISSANIGTIATNDLTVWENVDIGNSLSIRNGLNIGNGGILSNGAVAITVSTTISTTTLFSVGTSTPLFMVSADGSVRINTTSTSNYKLMVDSGSSTTAGIGVNGYIKASGFITGTTTLDLAETYPFDLSCVARGDCPVNGDLVCVDTTLSTGVKKCSASSTEGLIGVVSANPGFLLGGSEFGDLQATNTAKIALSGRVPVKVNIVSGTIKIGDELTVGTVDGTAQKALEPGQVIGIALENFGKENEPYPQTGSVLLFVNPHWSIGNLEEKDIPNDLPDFTTTTPNILDKFTLAIENSLQKLGLVLKNGVAKLKELIVDKIFTKQLCVGETCIGEQQLKDLLQNSQVSAVVQTAPLVNTQSFSPPAILNDSSSSFSLFTSSSPVTENTVITPEPIVQDAVLDQVNIIQETTVPVVVTDQVTTLIPIDPAPPAI